MCSVNIDDCFPNPCQNGFCLDKVNSYTCICPPGYNGMNCEVRNNVCASSPCLNGGTCQEEMNSFSCACTQGFTGDNCQTNTDDCSPNPCQNGGICEDRMDSFICNCQNGFTGATCSKCLLVIICKTIGLCHHNPTTSNISA